MNEKPDAAHVELIRRCNEMLDNIEIVLGEMQTGLPAVGLSHHIDHLTVADPREVIGAFYSLCTKIIGDLRLILASEASDTIHDDVLSAFVSEPTIVSHTPDLTSSSALSGEAKVPSLQHNVEVRLRAVLIIVRFLDIEMMVEHSHKLGVETVDDAMVKMVLRNFIDTVNVASGDFRHFCDLLRKSGMQGQEQIIITGMIGTYLQQIKDLTDPAMYYIVLDLFSNILASFTDNMSMAQLQPYWDAQDNTSADTDQAES